MTYAVDLSNLALEANGAAAGITANTTAISAISVGNSTVNTSITTGVALTATATAAYTPQIVLNNLANDATGAFFTLTKSRSGGASLSSDSLGTLYFNGTNTANGLTYAAAITAIQTSSANATATPAALAFNVLGGVEKMRITSNGNVGIGTASPTATLQVANASGDSLITSGSTYPLTIYTNNGSADSAIYWKATAGSLRFGTTTDGITTSGFAELMRITAAGLVGIGTSTPGTKLNVYSASAVNTIIRTQNTLGYIDIGPLSDGSVYGGYAAPAGGTGFTVGTSTSSYWRVLTNGAEALRISSNGNVGIGNSTPGSSLVVSGAITTGNTDLGNNQVATVAFAIAAAIAF